MSRSVLVIDDHGDLRHLVRIALRPHADLQVVGEAQSATTGLERCRDLNPDLVVLDLSLTERSGPDFIAGIRALVPRAGIVIFTARPTRRSDARAWGADELVRKDADISRLVHALRAVPRPESTWRFPWDPLSVRLARQQVADRLRELGRPDRIGDVTLVVSELASNAVLHAGTDFELQLDVTSNGIRIEVHDGAGGVPQPKGQEAGGVGGRGLLIVASIASIWGTTATSSGKCVWAELPA